MGFPFNRPKPLESLTADDPYRVHDAAVGDSSFAARPPRHDPREARQEKDQRRWQAFGFNRRCGSAWRCWRRSISIRVAISVALIEIVVGAVAGNLVGLQITEWVNFLAGFGAILLTFLAGTEIDPRIVRKHFWSSMTHRRRRFLRALSRRARLRAFRHRLAVAAGADRRHRAVDDLGRRRLRGDDRDRLQQDRDRQDHSRRLLHQRPRHRAGARHRLRPLRSLACCCSAPSPRSCSGCLPRFAPWFFKSLGQPGQRAADEIRRAHPAWRSAAWPPSPAARRCCRPISSAWRWRRRFSPNANCRTACGSSPSRS